MSMKIGAALDMFLLIKVAKVRRTESI